MINLSDPLDRLRAANPVLLTDPTLAPPDPILFQRITTSAPLRPDRPRRRARRFLPALLATSLIGGAAAYALLRGEVTRPQHVVCHELANLAADSAVVSVEEGGPVAACAEQWRRGVFGAGREAPELAECVLDSGVAGVFPVTSGEDVCGRLGLAPVVPTTAPPSTGPGATSSDPAARVVAFREAVGDQFLTSPCVEPAAATAIVRRELDRAGLQDWTIRGGEGLPGDGFSAQRPCATLSLRPENREVVLVPFPRR